jgi:UDP:flavonoid glycosyltransferase YjiC (YdhE family)
MAEADAGAARREPLRVLISVRPYRGHLHPVIPLARAFARAGHRVAIATAEDVAPVVLGAGLDWLPAGLHPDQMWDALQDEDTNYGYVAIKAKVADLLEIAVEMFPPDVVIRDPTDLAAAIVADVVGAAKVVYGLGCFIPRDLWRSEGADVTVDTLRAEYGLPPDPNLDSLFGELYLSVLPSTFERPNRLPVTAVQPMQYIPWDGDSATPDGAGEPAAVNGGRPTVLMTLGTVFNYESDMFHRFLQALATEPVDVICTLGDGADDALLENAPANVRFERYLPHSLILPRCQALLCHAGFNTVFGALHAGVPVVCVPLGSDHDFNAQRCAEDGVGLSLTAEEASEEAIREAVRRVLTEPSFAARAQEVRRGMERRPGLRAAVRRIEALVAEKQSQPDGVPAGLV